MKKQTKKEHAALKPGKTEMDLLFSTEEVEGYKIQPFSFGHIVALTPWFEKVAIELVKKGFDVSKVIDLDFKDVKSFINGIHLIPFLPEFFNIYLGEDIKVIMEWDFDKTQKIIAATLVKNFSYLKNSLSLLTGFLKEISKKISKMD